MVNVREGSVSMGVWWLAFKCCVQSLGSHKHELWSLSLDGGVINNQIGLKVTACSWLGDGRSL